MRFAWLLLLVGACTGAADQALGVQDPNGDAAPECTVDQDCVAASSACCECPTFALPATSGWSCAKVACDPDPQCNEVRAACDHNLCVLACAQIACDLSCAGGFAVDAAGCQTCACAAPGAAAQCTLDSDCARVPADCCGCAKGGADTAIPASEVDAHDGMLMCSGTDPCPGVDVCEPGATARCDDGHCTLSSVPTTNPMLPPGACGRPDLPACDAGLRCILNGNQAAEAAGVGVCAP
ncbi:MAG TPA: hypothetical protein VL463_23340 [Kofleriaceae bacterium]|nr:hypothetical protein [Kofleriaceae bacterium]